MNKQDGQTTFDPNAYLEALRRTQELIKPQMDMLPTLVGQVSDFAQLAVKSCITINGGALIAVPTFASVLSAGKIQPIVWWLSRACIGFGLGVWFGVLSSIAAFLITFYTGRQTARITILPVLRVQHEHLPHTIKPEQLAIMKKAERALPHFERTTRNMILVGVALCVSGFVAFTYGGIETAFLMVRIPHH